MANSPSQRWENGRLVERAVETNRSRVLPDGTEVGEKEEVEATTAKPYKAPIATRSAANRKAVAPGDTENKAVKARSSRTK